VLGFGAQAAQAQATIKSITADRTQVMLVDGKATIRFTVDGDAPENSNCGMIIDYSGIDASDNRKINRNDGLLPKVVERVFTRAGAYDVKARWRADRRHAGLFRTSNHKAPTRRWHGNSPELPISFRIIALTVGRARRHIFDRVHYMYCVTCIVYTIEHILR
jgi:hypothetical protein